ncbi:MAG: CopG family antitoxin [Oricola sp.]
MSDTKETLRREVESEDTFFETFERGDIPFRSTLAPKRRAEIEAMARAAMNDQREKISLRIPRSDLVRLKSRAMQEGIPYQTLINSLIHKYVSE